MSNPSYFDKYQDLAFERTEDGILTLRFQTAGGPIVFTGQTHEDLPKALEEIALDPDNQAMIITGSGDVFMDNIDGASLGEIFKPGVWEKIRTEGLAVLQRLLELPMPVVGVANGPATVHSEYLLLSDIHIASERATYGDSPHPAFGIRRRRPPRRVGGDRRNGARQVAALDRARRSTRRPRSSGACLARSSHTNEQLTAALRSPAGLPPSRRSTGHCKSRRSTSTCAAGSSRTFRLGWRSKA